MKNERSKERSQHHAKRNAQATSCSAQPLSLSCHHTRSELQQHQPFQGIPAALLINLINFKSSAVESWLPPRRNYQRSDQPRPRPRTRRRLMSLRFCLRPPRTQSLGRRRGRARRNSRLRISTLCSFKLLSTEPKKVIST